MFKQTVSTLLQSPRLPRRSWQHQWHPARCFQERWGAGVHHVPDREIFKLTCPRWAWGALQKPGNWFPSQDVPSPATGIPVYFTNDLGLEIVSVIIKLRIVSKYSASENNLTARANAACVVSNSDAPERDDLTAIVVHVNLNELQKWRMATLQPYIVYCLELCSISWCVKQKYP